MTTNFGGVDVVPLQGASVTTNFGGVEVVPLLCTCNDTQKKLRKNDCVELLADVTLSSNWFLLSGVYAGIIFLSE